MTCEPLRPCKPQQFPLSFGAEPMIHLFFCSLLSFSVCHAGPPKNHPRSIGTDTWSTGIDTCRTGKDSLTGRRIYLNADTGPDCEGGTAAWLRHVNKTLKVSKATADPIRTRYVIAFIVDKNGTISGERTVDAPNDDITKQLFAAVRTIRWISGKCHGKNVTMLHTVGIGIDYQCE
jgi:hypothetical protein